MVTATPSRRATAPALSASSATRPLRRVIAVDPDGSGGPVAQPDPRATAGHHPPARARTTGGRRAARPRSVGRRRPSAARRPRPGRAAAARPAGTSPEQHVVVLELDPTGGRVLGVVDVDADLGQLDRPDARAPRAAGGWPRSASDSPGGGWPQQELAQRSGNRVLTAARAGAAPGRPGRPATPRRPGAAGRARWCAAATVASPIGPCRRRRRARRGASRDGAVIGTAPVIRPAASLPEISTIGTPTPGWVPEPTKTTLDSVGCRLRGRNGPVWKKVCAAANGVPAAMPCVGPVGRGDRPGAPRCRRRSRRSRAPPGSPIELVGVALGEAAAPVERRPVAGWAPGRARSRSAGRRARPTGRCGSGW